MNNTNSNFEVLGANGETIGRGNTPAEAWEDAAATEGYTPTDEEREMYYTLQDNR